MDDDDRPGMGAALFDRAWDELHQPIYYMGMRVFPFDAQAARMERFIPLKLLFFWLDTLPHPRGCVPDLELLGLAQFHIRIGHLKTHGPSWRTIPTMMDRDPETIEVIGHGKVIGEVRVAELIHTEAEEPDNPLINIKDFAAWFREVSPEYLRLPAGFPEAESEAESDATAKDEPPLDEPEEWPTIYVLAAAFDGLHNWDRKKWEANLGGSNRSRWIKKCLVHPGVQGLAEYIRGHPVRLALGIIDKADDQARRTDLARLDAEFSKGELAAWRPHWMAARRKIEKR